MTGSLRVLIIKSILIIIDDASNVNVLAFKQPNIGNAWHHKM